MKVGDLVTLSAIGKNTQKIYLCHRRYFGEWRDFDQYWRSDKQIGLVTKITRKPRRHWSYAEGGYIPEPDAIYYEVAWQANPRGMVSAAFHIRTHLKFVKKTK